MLATTIMMSEGEGWESPGHAVHHCNAAALHVSMHGLRAKRAQPPWIMRGSALIKEDFVMKPKFYRKSSLEIFFETFSELIFSTQHMA